MVDPKLGQYIENVRQDVVEIYKCNESATAENRSKIRILALDTLMHLDKCIERQRRKFDAE